MPLAIIALLDRVQKWLLRITMFNFIPPLLRIKQYEQCINLRYSKLHSIRPFFFQLTQVVFFFSLVQYSNHLIPYRKPCIWTNVAFASLQKGAQNTGTQTHRLSAKGHIAWNTLRIGREHTLFWLF